MTDESMKDRMRQVLRGRGVEVDTVGDLASQLLWRIGRISDDDPVTVRVGLASSAAAFHDLPRLRSASDSEVERSVQEGTLRVEWVGARPRPGGSR